MVAVRIHGYDHGDFHHGDGDGGDVIMVMVMEAMVVMQSKVFVTQHGLADGSMLV